VRRRRQRRKSQGLDDEGMSVFRLKGPQQRPGQPVKKTYHDCPGIDVARTLSAVVALFKE
jgi:hypothetical protein